MPILYAQFLIHFSYAVLFFSLDFIFDYFKHVNFYTFKATVQRIYLNLHFCKIICFERYVYTVDNSVDKWISFY